MPRPSLRARFLARATLVPNGCVEWQGAQTRGYGQISHNGKMFYTHRVAYELFIGPIPSGAEILHACDKHETLGPFSRTPK